MWRVVIYTFLPIAFLLSIVFLQPGSPMTFDSAQQVSTLEPAAMGTGDNGQPKQQTIVMGPLAAFVPMKQLGTNGGGFFGMNSAHPFENPTDITNFLSCVAMMLFPFSLVLMYGRMLKRTRHSIVIFSVMMVLMVGTIGWAIWFDTLQPNPGLTGRISAQTYPMANSVQTEGNRT
jgi:K+-transporting ATPase ATPase A chain